MINKLPSWFEQDIPEAQALSLSKLFMSLGIKTVCREAKCPNVAECFNKKQATFLILGNVCTRNCKFCNVKKRSIPANVVDEPDKISNIVRDLGLKYVVITSVCRDDLVDGGANIFADTIDSIHKLNKNIKVEVLIPDFCGKIILLKKVLDARPEVLAHNIETVERLYCELRPMANYQRSLKLIRRSKELSPRITTKSSIMLGMGEAESEIVATMKDLRESKCDILTLGQYLAPSPDHYPIKEFISPGQFIKLKQIGLDLGFKVVHSGPKVRSSYHAQDLHEELVYV